MTDRKSHNSTLRPLSLKRQRDIASGKHKQVQRKGFQKKTIEQIRAEGKSVIQKLLGEGKIGKAIDVGRPQKLNLKLKSSTVHAQLDAEAVTLFNRMVRLEARNDDGNIICYICHRHVPFEESEAMHYHARAGRGIRFNERGVKAGCHSCNAKPNGDRKNFAIRLVEQYGQSILEELNREAKEVMRFGQTGLRDIIADCKNRIAKATAPKALPY